jgi:hypothetical protein
MPCPDRTPDLPANDGTAEAQGCIALMTVFTIVSWVLLFVGLLAVVGIIKF